MSGFTNKKPQIFGKITPVLDNNFILRPDDGSGSSFTATSGIFTSKSVVINITQPKNLVNLAGRIKIFASSAPGTRVFIARDSTGGEILFDTGMVTGANDLGTSSIVLVDEAIGSHTYVLAWEQNGIGQTISNDKTRLNVNAVSIIDTKTTHDNNILS